MFLSEQAASMRKKVTSKELRVAEYYDLLELLSRRHLPVVCSGAEDIHRILALRSASLVEALTEPPEMLRTGERRIGRAIVTAITPEGRTALARNTRALPASHRA
ncbi:hypothetical protein [Variovorax sp. RCC_210]|uniref:hypothetical protein n=1 Tax=Variovorax sp. RCC_210 TaxID=3239217 RepID=UPI003524B3FD